VVNLQVGFLCGALPANRAIALLPDRKAPYFVQPLLDSELTEYICKIFADFYGHVLIAAA